MRPTRWRSGSMPPDTHSWVFTISMRLGIEQHDLDPVDAGEAAHLLERGVDAVVEVVGREVHEGRGQPDQPTLVHQPAPQLRLDLGLVVDRAEGDDGGAERGHVRAGDGIDVHLDVGAVGRPDP